jgi:MoCo/4Fe-4S cofactor protein with predicted Tat translocation signal
MNNSTNSTPEMSGRRYWRSMDELADTPEFKDWLHREFPKGADEWVDDVSRRHFLRIMSASFALAGLGLAGAGCRRPVQKLEPFGKQPENYVFGAFEYYATAMPTRVGAVPLVVRAYDNRPIKIEGNSMFPGSNGGTDRYAQASILNLYDPDRARRFTNDGKAVSREDALNFLNELSSQFAGNDGEGLAFLAESSTSPSRTRLQKIIARKFPKSQWFTYDAIDSGIHQRAARQAFGRESGVRPIFHFEKAKVILSLDCDFLGGEDDAHNHIQRFAAGRKAGEKMSRLYSVESLFTLTGASSDHRLRIPASRVAYLAQRIYNLTFANATADSTSFEDQWAQACGQDLLAHKGEVLVVAGQRQPVEVHLLAHLLNDKLGASGKTLTLVPVEEDRGTDLADFNAATIKTLVVLGGNPAYNASSDFLHPLLAQAKSGPKPVIVRLGYYEDETSAVADWNFPGTHYLESWGDARTTDGTLVPVQPLIQPLFGGITELEFLARIAGESQVDAYDITRATFDGTDEEWKKFLFNGFQAGPIRHESRFDVSSQAVGDVLNKAITAPSLSETNLEVVFYRDARMDDGFYANNGWMQELPDPVTKITWDNAVLVSYKTAQELKVQNGDIVEISVDGGVVTGPIWTQPGMADYSLGLALGYGRERAGRVGTGVGFNAYKVFNGKYVETGATLRNTGGTYVIAVTQSHWSMEGRPAIREANLSEYLDAKDKSENFAEEFKDKEPPVVAPLYPNPFDESKKTTFQQWGMAVDLGSCVGCGTCVLACQSENNIPVVGKDQVLRGREMHWIRIDRYYTTDPKRKNNRSLLDPNADENKRDTEQQFESWIEDVQAVTQPMFCQMCEAAPCENVCPVNATSHDDEGLNVMTYNRCIGTRYCSNNCPYKVRRFNYLDFNKRPLDALNGPMYRTPLLPNSKTDGEWDLARWWKDRGAPMYPEDEWDLIKLSKNPDVTVRMRGVMEKCTYCVQRIQQAEIAQKVKAGASGNVRLKESEGTIPKTACQQACPAGAIVFGDITDPKSAVSRWKEQPRNYSVLAELLTKPRTTYLARVRNPNPAMPDYHEPYSREEYKAFGGVLPQS